MIILFGLQVHLQNRQVRFEYECHRVKVKVTGQGQGQGHRGKKRVWVSCSWVVWLRLKGNHVSKLSCSSTGIQGNVWGGTARGKCLHEARIGTCETCWLCTEDCDPKREFEHDCCELLISPFRYDQLIHDNIDVDEFVRSAFPEDTPLEKHVSVSHQL